MTPDISVIICTHNRADYLGAAIDSVLQQSLPNFELLVVDNASSDRTKEVVEPRLSDSRVRYIWEPTLGLSVARNRGAKESNAEILAYLDDDAVASPEWLQVLVDAYRQYDKLAIAGGKVTLIWPEGVTPPPWLSVNLSGNLGAYNLGDTMVYIETAGLTPRGLNYSIRRAFLDQIGGFDIQLGRIGTSLLSNEELHMTEAALQLGWQVAYLPNAIVAHNVAPERLNRSWFMQRSWWQGISECYRERLAGKAGFKQLGRGSERFARGLYNSLKHFSDPARRFDDFVYAYGQIGYLGAAIRGMLFPPKPAERS
mgnify:CR=1 FL=1